MLTAPTLPQLFVLINSLSSEMLCVWRFFSNLCSECQDIKHCYTAEAKVHSPSRPMSTSEAPTVPTSVGSSKKQESSRKTSTSALLTTPKPLTVWITTNWKILQETEISDHLPCLLRNLYSGQEATVRTRHRKIDCIQIEKGL